VGMAEVKDRSGVYPKVWDIPRVGNPTSICQIMTIDDSDGYEMCRTSAVISGKRLPAKSQQFRGITGGDLAPFVARSHPW
jgi:hypothetical protein